MTTVKPSREIARRVVSLVSHGLVKGVGVQEPGKMCVEAAVCFAFGLPHGDNPPCVSPAVRAFKIALNDSDWSSNAARAKGLRRLAVAQLGSNEIDEAVFAKELALAAVRKILPIALRAAAKLQNKEQSERLNSEADKCEKADILSAESAARSAESAAWSAAESAARSAAESAAESAGSAAWSAARSAARSAAESAAESARSAAESAESAAESAAVKDEVLSLMAECAVQALIKCKSPGCKWLDLCD